MTTLGIVHANQTCMCVYPHLNQGWRNETVLSSPVKYFSDLSKVILLLWIVCVLSCVCHTFVTVHCCLVVTC